MADGEIIERLVVEFDAKVDKLLDKMGGLNRSIHGHRQVIEKEGGAIGEALDRVWNRGRSQIMEEGASKLGVLGSGLEALGAAGLVAAASIAAVTLAFEQAKALTEYSEQIERAAHATGLTTTQLQEFDFVASQTNIDVNKMRDSLSGLSSVIGLVKSGMARSQTTRVFTEGLGISAADLRSWGDLEHQLPHILDAMSKLDEETRIGFARRLKIDPGVLNSLVEARDRVGDLTEQAHKYGLVLDADVIKKSAEAAEKMKLASDIISKNMMVAFEGLVGPMADASTGLAKFVSGMNAFISRHHAFIVAAERLGLAMVGLPGLANFKDGADTTPMNMLRNLAAWSAPAEKPAASVVTGGGGGGRHAHSGAPIGPVIEAVNDSRTALEAWKEAIEKSTFAMQDRDREVAIAQDTNNFGRITPAQTVNVDLSDHPFFSDLFHGHLLSSEDAADLHDRFANTIRGGLEAAFHGGIPGLLRWFGEQFLETMLTKMAAAAATNLLSAGGQGGGFGNFIATAFSFLGFADGGSPPVGVPSLVGERGPELFIPRGPGTIVPAGMTASMLSGGQVTLNVTVHAEGVSHQVAQMVHLGVATGLAAVAQRQARTVR